MPRLDDFDMLALCRNGELDVQRHLPVEGIENVAEIGTLRGASTLLETAIGSNRYGTVQDLLPFGFLSDLDQIKRIGRYAARYGKAEVFELVWDAIVDSLESIHRNDGDHVYTIRHAMYDAVKWRNIDVYRVIVSQYYIPTPEDYDSLMYAMCCGGHVDAVRDLLPHTDVHRKEDASLVMHILLAQQIRSYREVKREHIRSVLDLLMDNGVCVNPQQLPIRVPRPDPDPESDFTPYRYDHVEWEERSYQEYKDVLWRHIANDYVSTSFVDYVLARLPHTADDVTSTINAALEGPTAKAIARHLLRYAHGRGFAVDYNQLILRHLGDEGYHSSRAAVDILLEWHGPELLRFDGYDVDALLSGAVSMGCIEVIQRLLFTGMCDMNKPLLSRAHDPAVVRMLVDAKAAVRDDERGTVTDILRHACMGLNVDLVKAMVDTNVAVVDGNITSNSLLQRVMRFHCKDEQQVNDKKMIINAILDAIAPTLREERLIALFHESIHCEPNHDQFITMKVMLERYPGLIHSRGYFGMTPLMSAVNNSRCPVKDFKSLIDYGLYVDDTDDSGRSILDYVIFQYYLTETHKHEMLRLVLSTISDLDQLRMSLLYLMCRNLYCYCHRDVYHCDSKATAYLTDILDHILSLPISASASDAAGAQDQDSVNGGLRDAGVGHPSKRQRR